MKTGPGAITSTRRRQELGTHVGHDGRKEQVTTPRVQEEGETSTMNIRRRQG